MTTKMRWEHTGGRTGTAPLTWGQQAICAAMGYLGPDHHHFNSPWDFAAADGWTLPQVWEALRKLFDTYESLRTHVVTIASGEPRQILHDHAEVPVDILDVDDAGAEDAAVARLRELLIPPPFDYANETSLRVGLVRRDDLVRRVVFVVSHHVADGESLGILSRDFAAFADGAEKSEVLAERDVVQPLELAAHQATTEGRRTSDKSLRFWQQKLESLPSTMVPAGFDGGDPREPRFWQARLRSRELLLAVNELADQHQVSSTNVILAAGAGALGATVGSGHCVLQIIANNRISDPYRHIVSTISLEGLFAVELTGSFADLVQRTRRASLAAYRFANYDKVELLRIIEKIEAERGERIERFWWFNDTRVYPPADRVSRAELVARLAEPDARQGVTWPRRFERQGDSTLSLHVIEATDVLELELTADTHLLGPHLIEQALLRLQDTVFDQVLAG